MTGYRTEIMAALFTLVMVYLIATDKIMADIGIGLILTQVAPLFAAKRASRNTKRLDDAMVR